MKTTALQKGAPLYMWYVWAAALCLFLYAASIGPAYAENRDIAELEANFRSFLNSYIREIKNRNEAYLRTVHPDLPKEMYGFFFDVTQDMMKHAERKGLKPDIKCKEYNVCKVTWPQPGGSWAAQSFIKHKGAWRWLEH